MKFSIYSELLMLNAFLMIVCMTTITSPSYWTRNSNSV